MTLSDIHTQTLKAMILAARAGDLAARAQVYDLAVEKAENMDRALRNAFLWDIRWVCVRGKELPESWIQCELNGIIEVLAGRTKRYLDTEWLMSTIHAEKDVDLFKEPE